MKKKWKNFRALSDISYVQEIVFGDIAKKFYTTIEVMKENEWTYK